MATIIRANGEKEKTEDTSLENLQKIVGGWIEPISFYDGRTMYVNEDGNIAGLPVNMAALDVYDFPDDIPCVFGDVVVLNRGEDVT